METLEAVNVKVKLRPMNDFVLVQRIDEAQVVTGPGNLLLKDETLFVAPNAPRKKSQRARVIGVGEGRIVAGALIPIDLQEGDVVFITKYGGTDVTINDEEYVLVRCGEIYGRVESFPANS